MRAPVLLATVITVTDTSATSAIKSLGPVTFETLSTQLVTVSIEELYRQVNVDRSQSWRSKTSTEVAISSSLVSPISFPVWIDPVINNGFEIAGSRLFDFYCPLCCWRRNFKALLSFGRIIDLRTSTLPLHPSMYLLPQRRFQRIVRPMGNGSLVAPF